MPIRRVAIGTRTRTNGRLIFRPPVHLDSELSPRQISATAAPGCLNLLGGGEPTLRADLPEISRALSHAGCRSIGIITDGFAIGTRANAASIRELGFEVIRVLLHTAQKDANDWLTGTADSVTRALRAMNAVRESGARLEVECIVTRPTVPLLAETVELLSRMSPRRIVLRCANSCDVAPGESVMLLPRWSMAAPFLRLAASRARRADVDLQISGFPRCAIDGADLPLAIEPWSPALTEAAVERCEQCPGAALCGGIDRDYVEVFGWQEVEVRRAPRETAVESRDLPAATPPPVRAGRSPATRLTFAKRQAARRSLGGDPLGEEMPRPAPDNMFVTWYAPSPIRCPSCAAPVVAAAESSRSIRIRLSRAAQEGAATLRVSSASLFHHPDAAELLRETTRLSFARVEISGEGSALARLRDGEIAKLRGISRIDVPLYGPDAASHDQHIGIPGAFETTLAQLRRFAGLTGAETGCYAVLHDGRDAARHAPVEWWWHDRLLFVPRYGGSDRVAAAPAGEGEPEAVTR